jgi:2-polyprenyl-3-methyl-5-hydroxy-6-metoxy-1,4-benzoquinol methylase
LCPYCGSGISKVIDRKYIFTTLNECSQCSLFFRHPLDTIEFNYKFYQEEYEQNDGITTDLPSDVELQNLMSKNFFGSGKDVSGIIKILKSLLARPTVKVIDYGANWGYTSYQFRNAGFDVQSYEISLPRAKFGKKLGLEIITDENSLIGNVDIFFNSHVIEHLPDIKHIFLLAQKLLTNDGYFISFCPNGSLDFKKKHPENFHTFWGQVHPNYLNSYFFCKAFKNVPYLIGSDCSKQEDIEGWDKNCQKILDVSGIELFVFAKIKNQHF